MAFTITGSGRDGALDVRAETAAEAVERVYELQDRGASDLEIRDSNGDPIELVQLMALAAQDKR